MALEYVSVEEAKLQCRVSHTFDDVLIDNLIKAASGVVKNHLKSFSPYEPERDDDGNPLLDSNDKPVDAQDSNGTKTVREEVKLAVLILVAEWYRNPQAKQEGSTLGQGYLPDAVVAILNPLRDPACQ